MNIDEGVPVVKGMGVGGYNRLCQRKMEVQFVVGVSALESKPRNGLS